MSINCACSIKILLITTAGNYIAHTQPIFKYLNILKIDGRYKLQMLTFLFNLIRDTLLSKLDIACPEQSPCRDPHTVFRKSDNLPYSVFIDQLLFIEFIDQVYKTLTNLRILVQFTSYDKTQHVVSKYNHLTMYGNRVLVFTLLFTVLGTAVSAQKMTS